MTVIHHYLILCLALTAAGCLGTDGGSIYASITDYEVEWSYNALTGILSAAASGVGQAANVQNLSITLFLSAAGCTSSSHGGGGQPPDSWLDRKEQTFGDVESKRRLSFQMELSGKVDVGQRASITYLMENSSEIYGTDSGCESYRAGASYP